MWCNRWFDMIWFDLIWFDMIWYDLIWFDKIWFGMVWYDMIDMIWFYLIWFDLIWYDIIWYGTILYDNMIWYDLIWFDMISYNIFSLHYTLFVDAIFPFGPEVAASFWVIFYAKPLFNAMLCEIPSQMIICWPLIGWLNVCCIMISVTSLPRCPAEIRASSYRFRNTICTRRPHKFTTNN